VAIRIGLPSLIRVKFFLLLILIAVVTAVVMKYRVTARRDRNEVMARLDAERKEFGIVSPTAELFREVGVPVPPELRAGLVGDVAPIAPPPAPTPAPPAPSAEAPAE